MTGQRQFERWAPLLLVVALLILWQVVVQAFAIPEFIFPSPWQIAQQFAWVGSVGISGGWCSRVLASVRVDPTWHPAHCPAPANTAPT